MLHGTQLDAAVRTLVSRPLRKIFFRAMLLKFSDDPLGKRRPIRRNRFNIDNGARVLYLAEFIPTALMEIQAFGFPPSAVAIVPVEVELQAVVDLRDPAIQSALHLSASSLAMNFRTVPLGGTPTESQELGECAAVSRVIDGFLYESLATPGSVNLAVFENNLVLRQSSLAVNDSANNLYESLP